ncbi:hypothetical protein PYW08_002913 [Mythimna loreyi]|uniref:Uncharacterized protein n=1 Tax=Mythimna loreyi TaxID=667449 RepID=A0ACC2QJD5_9NEOP|nr:hypothetical protein PYW08_002913 [Mythimna loreyi]
MLISKIPDNDGAKGESVAVSEQDAQDSHDYQTANELFELMAKNQTFDTTDVDKLTTRDLVLLYKNIDLGTKLMSNANELKRKKPNQRVENIVYNDESDSDLSERFSSEELRSVFRINDERLDLINDDRFDLLNASSAENTLCHKLGNLKMQTSNLATDYDKHFLFKDPYINEQLKNLKEMNKSCDFEGAVLPASLLDYICCKRLEDNYNFYMDNIIRYVKNTIDQLKRISNGDYLTEKAKEKWREVIRTAEDLPENTKVLATSTSIPLHVERKISGGKSTWDDIVHSAVDVRSLSKILEKKIVVEVPKILCGSYKLLSKCCAENLIITCKKDKRAVEERVDVVLQLQRSETGQVISNINSIMILQSAPVERDTLGSEVQPLPCSEQANMPYIQEANMPYIDEANMPYTEETNNQYLSENKLKIIELEPTTCDETVHEVSVVSEGSTHSINNPIEGSYLDGLEYTCSDSENASSLKNSSFQESSDSNDALKNILHSKFKAAKREASGEVFPDDLRLTMRKLTMQSALTEESGEEISLSTSKKRKSPTRVRIKSPYENQSFIMEEKKRRKLLEIREKREKKKMALAENCKITKHKYVKGNSLPQSASSVTKLSISNKSFYNSIYGQANGDPSKQEKGKNRKGGRRDALDIDMDDNEGEHDVSVVSTPDNSKKYINRSYYLDDADTEMMYINMKRNESDAKDLCSTSTSVISNVFRNNLNYLSQLIGPSKSELNIADDEIYPDKEKPLNTTTADDTKNKSTSKELVKCESVLKVPENSPKISNEQTNTDTKKLNGSVECKKSIDKIYTLMNTLKKVQETEHKPTKSKFVLSIPKKVDVKEGRMSSTCQGSESGTSLKHHTVSSNPSSFSFDKSNIEKLNNTHNKKPGSLSPVVPKVIISSKSPTPITDTENNRKNRRKSVTSPTKKISDNPLKAISQLLHEFENVQKNRQKPNAEQKVTKKIDVVSTSDGKSGRSALRKSPLKRRSRLDQHTESEADKSVRVSTPKEKKPRHHKELDSSKNPYQQTPVDDKHTEKPPRKKIIDILDEAKEARGEAVRGPSKLYSSRLNSLAQPKKSYVQAHSEEYHTKYGRNLMADRLHRLAATPHSLDRPTGSGNTRTKAKRSGMEPVPAAGAVKSVSPVPPSERVFRKRQSRSSSPEAKDRLNQVTGSSFKQVSAPETPQGLMKKMVAVESYVKNHYGRVRTLSPVVDDPVLKSRVPLLPIDIELASSTSSALTSFQESTELGSRLHNIINSIMKTSITQGLEVLPEGHESTSVVENLSAAKVPSSCSDYVIDVLNDNNVKTSVENTEKEKTDALQNEVQTIRSVVELEKLENALCSHIPAGSFQKRLRIKNLIVTPKQSKKNIFVLQSGDASSVVVQTPIVQNTKNKNSENFSELTVLPILSKSHLDWNFNNFPMKISTVGYAFPDYNSVKRSSNSLIQLADEVPEEITKETKEDKLLTKHKSDKDNHTSKNAQPALRFEQAAQVDFLTAATLVTIGISTSSTLVKESVKKREIKQDNATNEPSTRFSIDRNQNKTVEDKLNGKQTQTRNIVGKKQKSVANKPEEIDYTTSLDILVGLLNEIQNISSCQTQMTKDDKIPSKKQQSKMLETILINEAATLEENSLKSSRCDVVSLTSLDRLRQLESNPSLYSFYISDSEGSERRPSQLNFPTEIIPNYTNELWCPKRIYVDKEVGADVREAVNKVTDVPSQLLPPGISHSIDATRPLVRRVSKPSIQSMLFAECPSVDSVLATNAAPSDHKRVINTPHILITRGTKKSLDFYDADNQIMKSSNEIKSRKKIKESFEKVRIKTVSKADNDKFRFKTDFDPIMKMKRDVLVTVYSILVFTVFAALSFPEMLYRI